MAEVAQPWVLGVGAPTTGIAASEATASTVARVSRMLLAVLLDQGISQGRDALALEGFDSMCK